MPGGQAVQGSDDVVDLPGVGARQGRDDELRLPAAGNGLHVSILLKAVEGAPDRSPTHSHVIGKLAFHDPGPRCQRTPEDQLPDLLEGGVVQAQGRVLLAAAVHEGPQGFEVSGDCRVPGEEASPRLAVDV